jgi:hypothetical protein
VRQASAATLAFLRPPAAGGAPLAQQRSDRFTGLYTVGRDTAIGAWIGLRALRQRPARGGSSVWLTGGGRTRVATVALLLGLLAALRYATWQGPVGFSAPEVHFLLGAPLPRAELVRVRLARGLLLGAAVGAALGLGAVVLLEAELGVAAWPLGVRRRHPRHRWLAVPWRDALSLLRAPGRVGWALVLGGSGALAVAVAPGRKVLAAGAVVAAYLGAAQLVEPLRAEADQPDASRQFPWRWGDLLLLHTVTPILTLTMLGLAVAVTAALLGLLPGPALGMALAACLPVAAALVWSAAIAGQRAGSAWTSW